MRPERNRRGRRKISGYLNNDRYYHYLTAFLFLFLFGASLALLPTDYDLSDFLDLFAGTLALVLFSLSFYTWLVRRQRPLLIVSIAFLAFFVKVIIEIQPGENLLLDLVSASIDAIFLLLIFLAVVIRPRKTGTGE